MARGTPKIADFGVAATFRETVQGRLSGDNDLSVEMLDRDNGILCRSIRRRAPLNRVVLYGATATAADGARVPQLRSPLEINPTDRPYHIGWILEAWAGREDYADDG
jgi:hypothetical protein